MLIWQIPIFAAGNSKYYKSRHIDVLNYQFMHYWQHPVNFLV